MTTLEEIGLDLSAVRAASEAGYISERPHPDDSNLVIFNYTAKAQYERAWSEETMTCRGLVLDIRGNDATVIARPFKKFFNLAELESVPEGAFVAQEKMDGSLGIIYRAPDGQPSVATRGSFTSEQALWATEFLRGSIWLREAAEAHLQQGHTPLVEIIYPENRIVIDYGGLKALVGLTAIDNATGRDVPLVWHGLVAETYSDFSFDLFREQDGEGPSAGGFNREGVVLLWEDGTRAKVKFEEYVRLHHILTRVTERSIWELLKTRQPIASLADYVPDEFFKWMQDVEKTLLCEYSEIEKDCFTTLSQVDRAEPRKSQAEFILSQLNSGIVFRMLDNKPYQEQIWDLIRPEVTSPVLGGSDGP